MHILAVETVEVAGREKTDNNDTTVCECRQMSESDRRGLVKNVR